MIGNSYRYVFSPKNPYPFIYENKQNLASGLTKNVISDSALTNIKEMVPLKYWPLI